ncbi:hypothetical protein MNEG_13235, partial [Monoraphidium neglectum]
MRPVLVRRLQPGQAPSNGGAPAPAPALAAAAAAVPAEQPAHGGRSDSKQLQSLLSVALGQRPQGAEPGGARPAALSSILRLFLACADDPA